MTRCIVEYQHWQYDRAYPTWRPIASIEGLNQTGESDETASTFQTIKEAAAMLHDGAFRQNLHGRIPMGTIRIRRLNSKTSR